MRRVFQILLAIGLAGGLLAGGSGPSRSEALTLSPVRITEWKAVYGTVEARDRIPARARLGGTLEALSVLEGDEVGAGHDLATIVDDKLGFQLAALTAQSEGLAAQLANAEADLSRGEALLLDGVTTTQRVDALRAQVDTLKGQAAALAAQADVILQQAREGTVLAPVAGRVLDVPVAKGAVVMPGEVIAVVGGGGTYLRISVPERHALTLVAGDTILISGAAGDRKGILARVYPLVEGGRLVADVEIPGLPDSFIGTRMLVRLPVGQREALLVPQDSIMTRAGLDFVAVMTGDHAALRSIVPGETHDLNGMAMVEVISGLTEGDVIVPISEIDRE